MFFFKQDLSLSKNKAATNATKFLSLNDLKYKQIEIHQKCHQMSTFIRDLV